MNITHDIKREITGFLIVNTVAVIGLVSIARSVVV